jgi:hypothetical protein
MIRIFLLSLFIHLSLQAGLINAIAMTVNDEPITLVDIDTKMNQLNSSKEKAIAVLVDETLYKQQLKKYNIVVDDFDIDRYLEKLAQQNNMSLFAFKNAIKQQQDFNAFKAQITQQLKHQKLVSSIASNKLSNATDEDIKIYYENNKEQFKVAKTLDVIHYTTKNKSALENIKNNPMMQQTGVNVQNITLDINKVTSQTQYILTQTKSGAYSAIYAENGTYNLFFVSNKKDITTVAFDKVKNNIYSHLMQKRQEEFLKNYFEGLKIDAKINILR